MSYPSLATVGPLPASTLDGYRHLGVYKSADTTRNSAGTGTTLTADPHLSVEVAASAAYLVTARLAVDADAVPDFKWDFTGPPGATLNDYTYLAWGAANLHDYGTLPTLGTVGAAIGDGNVRPVMLDGTLLTAGTAGSLTLRWAQNTSSANNTILKAGSFLHLVRIG